MLPKAFTIFFYKNTRFLGFSKVIFLLSEEDYDAFCLAYMFTYRDFEGGTLGLAWTGDMKNAGGVCERNGVSSCMSNAGAGQKDDGLSAKPQVLSATSDIWCSILLAKLL